MEQSQLMSTPQERNVDWERGRILRIYIGLQAIKCHCFLPQPPPPPPHFYCFSPTTTAATTFQLFSLHHHRRHHISVVFYPSPTRFIFFSSTKFYKRLPTAIFSSFCSNVSCSEQQSLFSSAVGWLPCLSAPVSFKDSYSTTTICTSPSLIQSTHGTHCHPRRK